jgi:MFS family permease
VGLVFQALSFGIGIYCFTFWVAPWTREFGVGRGEAMTVYLGMQLGMGLLAPFAGRAMDRLSIRALVCAGALSLAAALALAARATQLAQLQVLYATLVVAGMLLAGPLAAQTLATRWFTQRRGLALGISTVGTSLGGLALPPLVAALHESVGWRSANDVLAALVVGGIVPLTWGFVRSSPSEAGVAGEADDGAMRDAALGVPAREWRPSAVLRAPTFWLIVLTFTAMGTVFGAVQQNLAPLALDTGIDARATAWLVSTLALVMALAKVLFGALADRVDVRWLLGSALAVLAVMLAWLTRELRYAELAAICALLGFAAGANLPLLAAVVSRRFGTASFGLVMGLVGPFSMLSAFGPWLAGHLRDTTGAYTTAWIVLGALLAPAALAIAFLQVAPPAARLQPAKQSA